MKKYFIFILSVLLMLGVAYQARAEQSSDSATGTSYLDNQVFTVAYNNSGSDITSHSVVILDTSATKGSTLGAYITTTTTADQVNVFGVTDNPTCTAGTNCRVIIRGPAQVLDTDSTHAAGAILATSTTAGATTTYSTADGTAGGQLGQVIGTPGGLGPNYAWVWVNPILHK